MAKKVKKQKSRREQLSEDAAFHLILFLLRLFTTIPFRLRYHGGEFLGRLAYRLFHSRRRVVLRNLELAFPEWNDIRRKKTAEAVFVNFGRLIMETIQISRFTPEEIRKMVTVEGWENCEKAMEHEKGAIFITAHFGNWELSAITFSVIGKPAQAVMRPLDSPLINRLVEHLRMFTGNEVVNKRRAAGPILQHLRKGGIVGILMDQNQLRSNGIFADFFGISACTTPAIAMFARKTGCLAIPGFLAREGYKKFRFIILPPIEVKPINDKEADYVYYTSMFNQVIEDIARRYPDQYFWLHRRWKTRPEGESSLYD